MARTKRRKSYSNESKRTNKYRKVKHHRKLRRETKTILNMVGDIDAYTLDELAMLDRRKRSSIDE